MDRVLRDMRSDVDSVHTKWYEEVATMCQSAEVTMTLPRLCGRQRNRANVPAQTPSEYYCRTVTTPILDHLISEIQSRFSAHHKTALLGLHLIPLILVTKLFGEIDDTLKPLKDLYVDDLQDESPFKTELHQWYLKWKAEKEANGMEALPKTLAFTLPHCSSYYANIYIFLRIACTLPVTSCFSERSFSALKRIKTNIRSNMSNERLTSLTLLHVHQDNPIDIPEVINEFARRHPRRLRLTNMLADSSSNYTDTKCLCALSPCSLVLCYAQPFCFVQYRCKQEVNNIKM